MHSRRKFIKIGAASVGSLALRNFGVIPALAQNSGSNYQALVCIFLYGGNDSNNMIIPESQWNNYVANRGDLALVQTGTSLPASDLITVSDVNNVGYYFHPKLTNLASLFSRTNGSKLAVAANVGPVTVLQPGNKPASIPSNLFSHADQQAEWQTTDPTESNPILTGWGGRLASLSSVTTGQNPKLPVGISIAGNDIFGVGAEQVEISPGGNLTLSGYDYTGVQARSKALNSLLTTETGLSLYTSANAELSQAISAGNILGTALKGLTLKTTFPAAAGSLGQQLQQVALIMKANQAGTGLGMTRQIFFVSDGGFDTHYDELATLNNLYPQLDQAVFAFWQALDELNLQNNVVVFTESEFSRTLKQTSTSGADHAWGSHHLVLGGQVRGQQIYNSFPTLINGGVSDYGTTGRWVPTCAVEQYGATLVNWFGVGAGDINTVFPTLNKLTNNGQIPNPLTFLPSNTPA